MPGTNGISGLGQLQDPSGARTTDLAQVPHSSEGARRSRPDHHPEALCTYSPRRPAMEILGCREHPGGPVLPVLRPRLPQCEDLLPSREGSSPCPACPAPLSLSSFPMTATWGLHLTFQAAPHLLGPPLLAPGSGSDRLKTGRRSLLMDRGRRGRLQLFQHLCFHVCAATPAAKLC